jgi:two-component system response regulator PilR (NtrC family)
MQTILIVDDELSMREFLKILLEKEGYCTLTAKDGDEAISLIEQHLIDLVISDIRMPVMSGLELLAALKEKKPDLPVIMITAFASPEDAVTAMKQNAFDYITKPFDVDEIKKAILAATSRRNKDDNPGSASEFPEIIGKGTAMSGIFDLIKCIAPTPASVMIYGESGTGKELVAKAIHRLSRAAANPFIPITCSSIPETLLESELFGHVKGSFTGALADKAGLFQQADSGTVFLDEIGELSPLIQTKLLRVLQEREFVPVGSTKTIQINIRIISATNRILEEEVIKGNFREDLYYRLAVVPIRVPPLRERKEDIPLLVEHFMEKYSTLMGKHVNTLSSYGMEVLMEYDFPGNVRELENIIERGVALESSNIILPESLALSLHKKNSKMSKEEGGSEEQGETSLFTATMNEEELFERGMEDILTGLEKKIIAYALDKSGNSKMKAAGLLKISFRSLRYKTKKYGLS